MKELERLSEEERRALRGSKFAPLPSSAAPPRTHPRLAHPGGPLRTNKAAALAKFLERKLQDPNGVNSLDPDLLELAVKNAKQSVTASGPSCSRAVRHVDSFGDSDGEELENSEVKRDGKKKKNKKKRKKKKQEQQLQLQKAQKDKKKKKMADDTGCVMVKKSKKLKL